MLSALRQLCLGRVIYHQVNALLGQSASRARVGAKHKVRNVLWREHAKWCLVGQRRAPLSAVSASAPRTMSGYCGACNKPLFEETVHVGNRQLHVRFLSMSISFGSSHIAPA